MRIFLQRHNAKAQALAEMAVLGSVVLVIFSMILSYGQRFNEQQALTMDAFRMALYKSGNKNSMVSYTIIKHSPFAELFGEFGKPQVNSISGSASVLWVKGKIDNIAYYQINDDVITSDEGDLKNNKNYIRYPTGTKTEDGESVTSPAENWDIQSNSKVDYHGGFQKNEDERGITTRKQGLFAQKITTTLRTRFNQAPDGGKEDYIDTDPVEIKQYAYRDGNGRIRYSKYASDKEFIRSERTWETQD